MCIVNKVYKRKHLKECRPYEFFVNVFYLEEMLITQAKHSEIMIYLGVPTFSEVLYIVNIFFLFLSKALDKVCYFSVFSEFQSSK
jgi:hypothetical protein